MRTLVAICLAGMVVAPLLFAGGVGAEELQINKRDTSLKQLDIPNPNMLARPSRLLNPTPGVENRGMQRTDPAGPRPAESGGPHRDGAAEAAANTTTDASQMTAREAAATISSHDR
jgi:hypothetical protein